MNIIGPFTLSVEYPSTEAELDTSVIRGVILAIGLRYTFGEGSSMDVSIATKGETMPTQGILSLTGANTDGWFNVRETIADVNGDAVADQYGAGVAVYDVMNIAIANANDNDTLEVWFKVLD